MTLKDMQICAAETLSYFVHTMPESPFAEGDIIIEFAKKNEMAERAKALCKKYVPNKVINESQARQLANTIAANALIGIEKSAVIVRINHKNSKQDWQMILFHEFMHIYCAKLEMNENEHFIDIYGSDHTPDTNPENKVYDGLLNAGYVVWSEFIAQYYALKETSGETYPYADVDDYIINLISEVHVASDENGKTSFAMACAYLLVCHNVTDVLSSLAEPKNIEHKGKEVESAFRGCLNHLIGNLQKEKPWEISEEFISELGSKFLMFMFMNSLHMGIM